LLAVYLRRYISYIDMINTGDERDSFSVADLSLGGPFDDTNCKGQTRLFFVLISENIFYESKLTTATVWLQHPGGEEVLLEQAGML